MNCNKTEEDIKAFAKENGLNENVVLQYAERKVNIHYVKNKENLSGNVSSPDTIISDIKEDIIAKPKEDIMLSDETNKELDDIVNQIKC